MSKVCKLPSGTALFVTRPKRFKRWFPKAYTKYIKGKPVFEAYYPGKNGKPGYMFVRFELHEACLRVVVLEEDFLRMFKPSRL
jgi:hypothetical protein